MKLSLVLASAILTITALVSAPSNVHAQQEPLRIAIPDRADYPFVFRQGGDWQGFSIDVVEAVAARLGMNLALTPAAPGQLFALLDGDKVDTVAMRVAVTPELRARFALAQPYIYGGAQIVVRRGDERIRGAADLAGRTVAVEEGASYHRWLSTLPFAGNIKLKVDAGRPEELVATGRADALVTDRVSALRLIARKPLPLQIAGAPLDYRITSLPFRRTAEGQALRNRVDDALTELKLDGTLERISHKWLDGDVTQP